jgi:hypothetical protein
VNSARQDEDGHWKDWEFLIPISAVQSDCPARPDVSIPKDIAPEIPKRDMQRAIGSFAPPFPSLKMGMSMLEIGHPPSVPSLMQRVFK